MIGRMTMSRASRRAPYLLVAWLLTTGLFAQVGLLRAPRPALATLRSCPDPVSEDADPVDDDTAEDQDERGEESTRGESDLVVPSSPSARRGAPGPSGSITCSTPKAARAIRPRPDAGHFLAAGRALRHWIQSQLC